MTDLDQEVSDAEEAGDSRRAEAAHVEHDRIVEALAAVYGLGGRSRRLPDEVERTRKAVRRRIADALKRIEHAHPELGHHLRASIHTGVYCSYGPELETSWDT